MLTKTFNTSCNWILTDTCQPLRLFHFPRRSLRITECKNLLSIQSESIPSRPDWSELNYRFYTKYVSEWRAYVQSLLQPIPGHSKESRRVASGGRRGGGGQPVLNDWISRSLWGVNASQHALCSPDIVLFHLHA